MILPSRKYLTLIVCLILNTTLIYGQNESVLKLVNPWIGTSDTRTPSLWGSEGGTYPGAVAPFGFVQLTPETGRGNSRGYDSQDSTIYFFSCIRHLTGYPNGSSGRIHIMPVYGQDSLEIANYSRPFNHSDEQATPGYYTVLFRDNGTRVEVSAAEHTGMFRFTFPANVIPKIRLTDLGKLESRSNSILIADTICHTVLSFSTDYSEKEKIPGGCILTFPAVEHGESSIILKIGVSLINRESSENNLEAETNGWDFDQFKERNQQKWTDALSVITVDDTSKINKTIFYTALYHSMLMPWIISDVKGNYKGADKVIHKVKGKHQYGGFSAWDTFRSLHPLLTLIAPDRQQEMLNSLLDYFQQAGSLPDGPMTGNHIIPIIVDSYFKGVVDFDPILAYNAMNASLTKAAVSKDFADYQELGYVPAIHSESVTKSVEFAYDDWVLSQFAEKVIGDPEGHTLLEKRSFNYQHHFNAQAMGLVPRNGDQYLIEPGNIGYKEGDQWSYSMFVPHDPRGLINLFGGDNEFAHHLDSALKNQLILFDNEPVLHVPYLFNYANRADLTQKWTRNLMKTHYTNRPFGLPGNDDHGAMSSWYVFSAMGFFPQCPGRALFDLGSPIFKSVTINLSNGKKWVINTKNNGEDHPYVKTIALNRQPYKKLWLSNDTILKGGVISFEMSKTTSLALNPDTDYIAPSETKQRSDFVISNTLFSLKHVAPDQEFFVTFKIQNRGSAGTKILRLLVDGEEFSKKNVFLEKDSAVVDSIACRLYPLGKRKIRIDNGKDQVVEVIKSVVSPATANWVTEIKSKTISNIDSSLKFTYLVQNKGGISETAVITTFADDTLFTKSSISLKPGERKQLTGQIKFKSAGFHTLKIGSKTIPIKIYSQNIDSKVIAINPESLVSGDTLTDQSGLRNQGILHRKTTEENPEIKNIKTDLNTFVEFPNSPSLDELDEKITVMAWVKPSHGRHQLSDIITKGDFISLQTHGAQSLSWFAGGWGRGSVSAKLPDDWINNWHHIAGVAEGKTLKIFIDGVEADSRSIDPPANLSSKARWMIGRNEEFPDQRFFYGFVNHFKIFVEPLTNEEIKAEMLKDNPNSEF